MALRQYLSMVFHSSMNARCRAVYVLLPPSARNRFGAFPEFYLLLASTLYVPL